MKLLAGAGVDVGDLREEGMGEAGGVCRCFKSG